jgi:hypothetical protein
MISQWRFQAWKQHRVGCARQSNYTTETLEMSPLRFSKLVNRLSSFMACRNQEDSLPGDGLLKVLWNSDLQVNIHSKRLQQRDRHWTQVWKRVEDHHSKDLEDCYTQMPTYNCPKQIRPSACMCLETCAFKVTFWHMPRRENDIYTYLIGMGYEWIRLTQYNVQQRTFVDTILNFWNKQKLEFLS